MWNCNICSHQAARRWNIIRHLKLIHGLDDRLGRNATKDSNNCEKPTVAMSSALDICSTVMNSNPGMNSRELTWKNTTEEEKQVGGGHYGECEEEEEEVSEVSSEYTQDQIDNYRAEMSRRKCIILDRVLALLPPRLKPEAIRICDSHKENEHLFITDKNEVIFQGQVKPGSNILTLVLDELVKSPGNFKEAESQIDALKYLLAHQTKTLERERGVPIICDPFKSMFGGSESDSVSEDSTDGEEDCETGEEGESTDSDGSEEDCEEEYTDEDEVPPKKTKY